MKKQRLFKLTALLVLCCLMVGCKKEDNSSNEGGKGSIYGTVTDFATGDPVVNANVQLLMSGNATLHASITGSDGHYEIPDVPSGTYSIKVTKVGYSDLIDNNPVVIEKDKSTKRDLQIKKLPSSLHIYDNESHEISELNFGADEGVTQKTFNIFNGGSQSLQYVITIQAEWVSIDEDQIIGTIGIGVTFPIVVTIDRTKLADGNNTTTLVITSSADGGKELIVKAIKGGVPTVITNVPSSITSNSAICGGNVISEGNSTVTQRGICYSTTENPTITLNQIVPCGTGTGLFSCELTGLSPNTKYYVRAYATNREGTAYGDSKEFETTGLLATFEYSGTTYYVHPDAGKMTWQSAIDYCEGLTFDGHSDWFLPSKDELNAMYVNRISIGGFVTTGEDCLYWTSLEDFGSWQWRYWYQDFSNGVQNFKEGQEYYLRVRPIRKDGGGGTIPTVITNEASIVTSNSANCGGDVTSDGGAEIIERGIRYGTSQNLETTGINVPCNTNGTGVFTCHITGLLANTKYYYWAYAINSEGESHGERKDFTTTQDLPYTTFEYGGTTYYVHPEVGTMKWQSAMAYCDNLSYAGYSDWFLPNKDELNAMYVYRNTIGGFFTTDYGTESYYWSSTTEEEDAWFQKFYNGHQSHMPKTKYYRVRPIRKNGGGGGGSSQTYTYDFEDGWQGWQVIDADGDGYTWKWANSSGGYNGHNGSIATMVSESYSNDLMVALSPDNYLVSPQRYSISNGAKIKFYVCAQDVNYPAEHYGVAVSTQATPDSDDFVIIDEWTLSAKVKSGGKIRGNRTQGTWYLKTVDLSAYAGQSIWIAIRHFNCYDEFMIDVDDITIVTGN